MILLGVWGSDGELVFGDLVGGVMTGGTRVVPYQFDEVEIV